MKFVGTPDTGRAMYLIHFREGYKRHCTPPYRRTLVRLPVRQITMKSLKLSVATLSTEAIWRGSRQPRRCDPDYIIVAGLLKRRTIQVQGYRARVEDRAL